MITLHCQVLSHFLDAIVQQVFFAEPCLLKKLMQLMLLHNNNNTICENSNNVNAQTVVRNYNKADIRRINYNDNNNNYNDTHSSNDY